MNKTLRKVLRTVANHDPDYYDMYADANETRYAQLYLRRIAQHADAAGIRPPATILEAGCQAGRLAIPLAQQGFTVTGIDTSGFALRRARHHAQAAGVAAMFVRGDLIEVLRRHPEWRFDLVICAEVVYLSRQYREMLRCLAAAVRPGGLLCVSHRPKFYYLIEALKQYDVSTATEVLRGSEGPFRDSEYYNWQTEEELRTLYRSLGMRWVGISPIDQIAWLSGLNLERLTEAQRDQWLTLELRAEGVGRYLLVIAARPEGVERRNA